MINIRNTKQKGQLIITVYHHESSELSLIYTEDFTQNKQVLDLVKDFKITYKRFLSSLCGKDRLKVINHISGSLSDFKKTIENGKV